MMNDGGKKLFRFNIFFSTFMNTCTSQITSAALKKADYNCRIRLTRLKKKACIVDHKHGCGMMSHMDMDNQFFERRFDRKTNLPLLCQLAAT